MPNTYRSVEGIVSKPDAACAVLQFDWRQADRAGMLYLMSGHTWLVKPTVQVEDARSDRLLARSPSCDSSDKSIPCKNIDTKNKRKMLLFSSAARDKKRLNNCHEIFSYFSLLQIRVVSRYRALQQPYTRAFSKCLQLSSQRLAWLDRDGVAEKRWRDKGAPPPQSIFISELFVA